LAHRVVGVVMAYINKDDAHLMGKNPYTNSKIEPLKSALYMFLGTLLFVILIGWFIFLFWAIWLIVRCGQRLWKAPCEERAVENPTSWLF